ncbi:hypothetical protein DYB34_010748 [Aphanomyces astaci]|uniref:Uncharacterized protein n=1 Tax=Aphanomyces astaci TaxID=112090 RepID=A0A3R6YVZ6_APHAT|nr:hypothetical protein DYB34_010748 [Aphanomyces astaci]
MDTDFQSLKSPRASDLQEDDVPWSERPHPLESVSWLSYITVWWMDALIRKGAQAPLTEQDVWPLAKADTVDSVYPLVTAKWDPALKPRLVVVLWQAFRYRIVMSFLLFSLYAVLSLLQPIAVKSMMQYLEQEDVTATALGLTNGYALAFVLFVVSMTSACIMDFAGYYAAHIGINLKSAVANMVYVKTLSLSGLAKAKFSSGEVVTMTSVDLERITMGFSLGHWTFISPAMLLVIFIMLAFELGPLAAFIGGLAMAGFIYFGITSGQRVGHLRQDILAVQAQRVKLTNEVLQGIRVVKLYAWEGSIQDQLKDIRLREISCLTKYHNLRIINNVLLMVAPVVSLACCLMVFVSQGRPLTMPVAFTALAYMNITRQPCGVFSTSVIGFTEALASCRRLSDFFNAEELAPDLDTTHEAATVELSHADFSWTNDAMAPTLKDISLQLEPGTLTMVVGAVGSGKSSLVSAILGDVHVTSGSRHVRARFSYVNQESWIQHATVRDNIVFVSDLYDLDLYDRVIRACQLSPDLAMLPKGDLTEIGERGINLSGGQKARISLARAMYQTNADVFLLDDPLSALDVHVANAVFSECMLGLLRGKTSLLVLTSHYHLLPHAHRILVMADGAIVGDGSYEQLKTEFPHLMNLTTQSDGMATTFQDDQGEKDEHAKMEVSKQVAPQLSQDKDSLVVKEDNVKGKVTLQTYKSYLGASGYNGYNNMSFSAKVDFGSHIFECRYLVGFVMTVLFTISQVTLSITDWFMSVWARNGPLSLAYGWGYVALAGASVVMVYGRSIFTLITAMLCSKNFHSKVLRNVLRAPVPTFFDVTPVGRILNRFSSSNLPHFGLCVWQFGFSILSVLVVCAATTPWVLVMYVPVGYVYFAAQTAYNKAANEIKRLDGVTKSPLISLVSETYQGLSTIRAFAKSPSFAHKQREAIDFNVRFYFAFFLGARWFQMRLDFLGSLIVGTCAVVTVLTKSSVGLAAAGLSLTYSTQLSVLLSRVAIFSAWLDNSMTSVERLNHYNQLESEHAEDEGADVHDWPSQGAIAFESYSMRYQDQLDLVLTNISINVEPGHQVGICGRTGSGKSSLMAALFRMVPASCGRITIDGVDIASVSVTSLRQGLTIIPQDPVLFSGSIRLNLDPTNCATDAELWTALKQVHLSGAVIPTLEFAICERGSNLSVGQRQLVCIARALLRRSKVVVLDEATANIDPESDRLIQATMRECFENVTRLIIAHRLDTILDSDRILVLDAGVAVEYDAPSTLLANKHSAFAQLAQHAHVDLDKFK